MRFAKNGLYMLFLLALAGAVACDDDPNEPVAVDEAQLLVEHMESLTDPHTSFVISTQQVSTNLLVAPDDYLVIDTRAAADFAAGHIAGAVNVPMVDLPAYLEANDAASYENVILVCYSGQTAAFAAGVLRALGHDNVVSMSWGMSSWNPAFATDVNKYWATATSNQRQTQFVFDPSPAMNPAGELPAISTGFDTGAEILDARVEAVLAEGFGPAAITDDVVFLDLDDYYIINYWPANLYTTIGHIPGAINYDPATRPFSLDTDLTTLPTDRPIVIYCYTGQGSAFLAGYLRLMGYDVRTLVYGANSMVHDRMVDAGLGSAFDPTTHVKDFEYVTGG